MREYRDQLHQSKQPIPPRFPNMPMTPLSGGGFGGGGYVPPGSTHPGPGGGSRLLDALLGMQQAMQQAGMGIGQGNYPGRQGLKPPLYSAGVQAGIYDPNLIDPTTGKPMKKTKQIADYYKGNIHSSLSNTMANVGGALRDDMINSPQYQQIVKQAAINSGLIPPDQPAPGPGQMPPPAGVNPYLPLGPTNISPGAPGTNTAPPGSGSVYPPQYGPAQKYGQQY